MTAETLQQYRRYIKDFETFRTGLPDRTPCEAAEIFLSQLTPAQMRIAKYALEFFLRQKIPFSLRLHKYWRNEPLLEASVFRDGELNVLKRADALTAMERALIGVLFSLRTFEAAHAVWGDVDLSRSMISVPHGKGSKPAITFLTNFATMALREWRAVTPKGQPQDPLFIKATGGGYIAQGLRRQVRQILETLGLYRPYRGAHAFRRTFATEFLRQHPGELRSLQRLMRHESIFTTTRYDFPRPEDLGAKVQTLGI